MTASTQDALADLAARLGNTNREMRCLLNRTRIERDDARDEAAMYLAVLRDRHPLILLAARWPGYVTCFGLGVLTGMLLYDIWGVW